MNQLDKINLLNDYSIEELIINGCSNTIKAGGFKPKKFKIPKSLIKLKLASLSLSKDSWLYEYAGQNNYHIKRDFMKFSMSKNISNISISSDDDYL